MSNFEILYLPVGVPTFHLESAAEQFSQSARLLQKLCPDVAVPEKMLLSLADLNSFLAGRHPAAVILQNVTFANAAYAAEVLQQTDCPILLWTLREPVIDGGRLRLNSLTGAYSAANTMHAFGRGNFEYLFGSPAEAETAAALSAFLAAVRVREALRSLRMAAVGHTPQGFGFGRALDAELASVFGVRLETVEARELISRAQSYSDAECLSWLQRTGDSTVDFDAIPDRNRLDHARLLRAYEEYVRDNHIGALASRCWPDFFTAYGTPVCTVLSMLNDEQVAAACEADIYGALSMYIGMQLTGRPTFFGDPVSLDETEGTVTYWHCGAAAPSLARADTGAAVGVHPNRKIGPVMDFGCAASGQVTVFRIGRKPDGSFRFLVAPGEALDRPRQFNGTSVVVRTATAPRTLVEKTVRDGWEPHFVVIYGAVSRELETLARLLGAELCAF